MDQKVLFEIAKSGFHWTDRVAAIKNVTDQDILTNFAMNDQEWRVRKETVEKVKDQKVIDYVAEQDYHLWEEDAEKKIEENQKNLEILKKLMKLVVIIYFGLL